MMRRFAERLQLWRREKTAEREGSNPLSPVAFVSALWLAYRAYTLITSQQLSWSEVVSISLLAGFLLLYFCKSRWAWLVIPIVGANFLVHLPFLYATSSPRPRSGIWLSVLIGIGVIACGFMVRKRYYSYLEMERLGRY